MVTVAWSLVLSSLLSLAVDDCVGTDPLLLEYSDYYYDLYYGDYDDYSYRAGTIKQSYLDTSACISI